MQLYDLYTAQRPSALHVFLMNLPDLNEFNILIMASHLKQCYVFQYNNDDILNCKLSIC